MSTPDSLVEEAKMAGQGHFCKTIYTTELRMMLNDEGVESMEKCGGRCTAVVGYTHVSSGGGEWWGRGVGSIHGEVWGKVYDCGGIHQVWFSFLLLWPSILCMLLHPSIKSATIFVKFITKCLMVVRPASLIAGQLSYGDHGPLALVIKHILFESILDLHIILSVL